MSGEDRVVVDPEGLGAAAAAAREIGNALQRVPPAVTDRASAAAGAHRGMASAAALDRFIASWSRKVSGLGRAAYRIGDNLDLVVTTSQSTDNTNAHSLGRIVEKLPGPGA